MSGSNTMCVRSDGPEARLLMSIHMLVADAEAAGMDGWLAANVVANALGHMLAAAEGRGVAAQGLTVLTSVIREAAAHAAAGTVVVRGPVQ